MTRYGIEKKKLDHEKIKANAAAKSAEASMMDAKTRKDESPSKKFANVTSGIGGLARGVGGALGGIAALNDPSWYKKTGATEQTARLPSNPGPGSILPEKFLDEDPKVMIPNVMAIHLVHTIGQANGKASDAINYAAAYVQSQLRRFNSRSGNDYDPSDILELFIYGASARAVLEDVRFCVGAYNQYSVTHRNLAKTLIEAKGFDFSKFQSNRAEIITKFNEAVIRLNYLPLIKTMSFAERWSFLERLCIRDARTLHGAYYMFTLDYYPVYNPEDSKIDFHLKSSNPITLLDDMINALTTVTDSASMVIMLSDIRGAVQLSDLVETPLLDESYRVTLTESREMIDQIHNISLIPLVDLAIATGDNYDVKNKVTITRTPALPFWGGESYNSLSIYQAGTGYLTQGAKVRKTGDEYRDMGIIIPMQFDATYNNPAFPGWYNDAISAQPNICLDFDKDEITVDDILVGSRLTARWEYVEGRHNYNGQGKEDTTFLAICPEIYGTEVATYATIVAATTGNSVDFYHFSMYTDMYDWAYAGSRLSSLLATTFHWSPKQYILDDKNNCENNFFSLKWDCGRLVVLDDTQHKNIEYMCITSEFAIVDDTFKKVS